MINKMSEKLTEAAIQMVDGDPNLMLQVISEVHKEGFLEGYNKAIEVLQEAISSRTVQKGEKYYGR